MLGMPHLGCPRPITDLSDSDGEAVVIAPVAAAPVPLPPSLKAPSRVDDLPGLAKPKAKVKAKAQGATGKPDAKAAAEVKKNVKDNATAKGKAKVKAKVTAKAKAKAAKTDDMLESFKDKDKDKAMSDAAEEDAENGKDAAAQPPTKVRRKPSSQGDALPTKDDKKAYVLMKYAKHGMDGTYAIRKTGGHQVMEINVPKATAQQNLEIAEAVLKELNENKINEAAAKTVASKLKDALAHKLAAS